MAFFSAAASTITVSGAVVKIGNFFSKQTTSSRVNMGETCLSTCITILDDNKDVLAKKELKKLLERYDRSVFHWVSWVF